MLVYGSHRGILQSPGQFGGFHLYPEESEIPWRTGAEPSACYQPDRSPLVWWGRSDSHVAVWCIQGCTKHCLLYATSLWQTLRWIAGLLLGGVGSKGHHLTRADHLNYTLCSFHSLFLAWKPGEKNFYWMWLLQCVTASDPFVIDCV